MEKYFYQRLIDAQMSLHNFLTIKRKVTTDANDNVVAPKQDKKKSSVYK